MTQSLLHNFFDPCENSKQVARKAHRLRPSKRRNRAQTPKWNASISNSGEAPVQYLIRAMDWKYRRVVSRVSWSRITLGPTSATAACRQCASLPSRKSVRLRMAWQDPGWTRELFKTSHIVVDPPRTHSHPIYYAGSRSRAVEALSDLQDEVLLALNMQHSYEHRYATVKEPTVIQATD